MFSAKCNVNYSLSIASSLAPLHTQQALAWMWLFKLNPDNVLMGKFESGVLLTFELLCVLCAQLKQNPNSLSRQSRCNSPTYQC